jgi:hypothetical protein
VELVNGAGDLRDDVAEELEHDLGWQVETECSGNAFVKLNARWRSLGEGFSILEVFGLRDEYEIEFGPKVPAFQIVRACVEATADCWRCGTACEGDCGEPDGVTLGVDGDGTVYSRVL